MNIESDSIKVYPTSKRKDIFDRDGRLNTEKNLINIVNRLTGQKSFIISGFDIVTNTKLSSGSCNIGGYLISISTDITIADITGTGDTIYFEIYKSTTGTFEELNGIDNEDNVYTGLEIKRGSSITTTDTILPIAINNGGTWESIEISKLSMNLNQIQINSGVLNSTKNDTLENFLENEYEIDDGIL